MEDIVSLQDLIVYSVFSFGCPLVGLFLVDRLFRLLTGGR